MKKALVLGAGGFIGHHMVNRLKEEGYWVRGVDIKKPSFSKSNADEFINIDLTSEGAFETLLYIDENPFDEIYQYAADMGGAGYIFSGENDANVMHNSALINLNVSFYASKAKVKRIFYSSSACIYPEHNQSDPNNPNCEESSAYPANPDSEYGWEKLFSERLYFSFNRNYNLDVRVARYHNIFGPRGTWRGGKEKAPAAVCRKVAEAKSGDSIEIWGDGLQTRSFLYIDECVEATLRFMRQNDFQGPVNIGSDEMVTINQLAEMAIRLSNKSLKVKNIEGKDFFNKYGFECPIGVRGRNSDNQLYKDKMNWVPNQKLEVGISETYKWILSQV